jgi:C-methyltransferase C-terminal domain/Putative zinc binding domain/Methyltransferase domain
MPSLDTDVDLSSASHTVAGDAGATSSHVIPLETCRLCRSSGLVSVLDLGDQALTGVFPASSSEPVSQGPLELVWCRTCTLLQLAHSYEPTEMYGANYGYRSGLNRTMAQHLARKAAGLETLVSLAPGDVVLDIGSNDGTLLRSYATSPLHRIGIDPTADRFAGFYPADAEIIPEFFSAEAFRRTTAKPARIITSIAMFYDLEAPVAFATDVRDCLAPDGVWHFEQSYMPSMLRSTAYDTVCHEHLEYYSLETVSQILGEAGLALIDVRFNRVNGGSFAVTAAHEGSPISPRRVLIDWFIAQEERLNLHTPGPFRRFEERVFQHRIDFVELVRTLRTAGASVMGYGASTKGNVLLQFCGFGPDDIEQIGDVNPDKFGRVTPGSGITIVPEEEVRARRPDYLVVFPWHFRDAIVEREEEYLRNGGRLILPLPEIEIVGT